MKKIVFVDNSLRNLEQMLRSVINAVIKNKTHFQHEDSVEIEFIHVRWDFEQIIQSESEDAAFYNRTTKFLLDTYAHILKDIVTLGQYQFCSLKRVTNEVEYANAVEGWAEELTQKVRETLANTEEYIILLDVSLYHKSELEGSVFAKNVKGTLSYIVRERFMSRCLAYTQYVNSVIQQNWQAQTDEVPLERDVHFSGKLTRRLHNEIVTHLLPSQI